MNILLSIKPKYAYKIFKKEKTFEFRRVYFKHHPEKVYLYLTSPAKMIMGYFTCGPILADPPEVILLMCKTNKIKMGISKEEFFNYYKDSELAVAIKIKTVHMFDKPVNPYAAFDNFTPPQSYMYTNKQMDAIFQSIEDRLNES